MEREKEWKVRLVLSPQAVCPKIWHLFAYKLGDVSLGVNVSLHVGLLCKRPCTLLCYRMRDNNGMHENKNDRAMAVALCIHVANECDDLYHTKSVILGIGRHGVLVIFGCTF